MLLPLTFHYFPTGNLRLSTTPCWPRPVSTTTVETTLSSAQPAENTTGCAHWQLLTPVSVCLNETLLWSWANPSYRGWPWSHCSPSALFCGLCLLYLNILVLKKKLSLKHSTENNYRLDLMHWVFCISLQSVLIQDCWFATALCKQLVQAPVVHLSARWLCVPSPLRRFWHHQEHARPAAATSVAPFPHHIVINKIGVKGICWCLLVFFVMLAYVVPTCVHQGVPTLWFSPLRIPQ